MGYIEMTLEDFDLVKEEWIEDLKNQYEKQYCDLDHKDCKEIVEYLENSVSKPQIKKVMTDVFNDLVKDNDERVGHTEARWDLHDFDVVFHKVFQKLGVCK
jgi:hypothetical protein